MKKDIKFLKTKKLIKTAVVLRLLVSGVFAAITIYTLIPKHDKIAGIDTDVFIENQKAIQLPASDSKLNSESKDLGVIS